MTCPQLKLKASLVSQFYYGVLDIDFLIFSSRILFLIFLSAALFLGYSQLRDADMVRFETKSEGDGYDGYLSLDDVSTSISYSCRDYLLCVSGIDFIFLDA